jgi:tetratricopeptide (TPR) repeat protein
VPEPIRIFISYRREDTRHVAGRLGDRLIGEKFTVFMDIETIVPGMDFTAAVRQAVNESDVLLALIGSSWLTLTDAHGRRRLDNPDDWVVQEISTALQRGILVIPVLVDGVTMPDPADLPEPVVPLASRQALALRHESFAADAERLIEAINRLTKQRGSAAQVRELQTTYDSAIRAGREGRWRDAVAGLASVVAADPAFKDAAQRLEQARVRENLAQLVTELREHVHAGRWAKAVQSGDAVLRLDPRYPDAEGLLRRARLELDRDHAQRYDAGVLALRQGRWDAAAAVLAPLVAERPDYRDVRALLAQAQRQQRLLALHRTAHDAETSGRWADAVRALETMQSLDPGYADGPARLARARAKAGGATRRPTGPIPGPGPFPPPRRRGRGLLIGGIAALAVLLILITIIALASDEEPDDGPSPTVSPTVSPTIEPSPNPSPTSSPGSTAARLEQLRSQLPTSFAPTCEPYTTDNRIWSVNLVVALRCRPGGNGPGWVIYYQYDSTSSAQQAYRGIVGTNRIESDCTKTPGEMDYTATSADNEKRPGKLSCLNNDPVNTQALVWVDNELAIVANAWDEKLTFAQMKKWWENAGPYKP